MCKMYDVPFFKAVYTGATPPPPPPYTERINRERERERERGGGGREGEREREREREINFFFSLLCSYFSVDFEPHAQHQKNLLSLSNL